MYRTVLTGWRTARECDIDSLGSQEVGLMMPPSFSSEEVMWGQREEPMSAWGPVGVRFSVDFREHILVIRAEFSSRIDFYWLLFHVNFWRFNCSVLQDLVKPGCALCLGCPDPRTSWTELTTVNKMNFVFSSLLRGLLRLLLIKI